MADVLELPSADSWLCKRVVLEAEYLGIERLIETVKATAHRHLHRGWRGTDSEAAAAFDAEHGGLDDAMRTGVDMCVCMCVDMCIHICVWT